MAKKTNDLETEPFTVSTNTVIAAYLRRLVSTGAFGKNPAEAISFVLRDHFLGELRARERDDSEIATPAGKEASIPSSPRGRASKRKRR